MANSRKAFHFDLDEERLKSLYPSEKVRRDTKPRGGSCNRSWRPTASNTFSISGYESVHGMSYVQAYKVLEGLQKTYPWFKDCAKAATLTEIGRRHDVLSHLSQVREAVEPAPETQRPPSLQEEMADMRRASQALEIDGILEPPHRDGHDPSR